MMGLWEMILVALALAMDCFTVSIVSGVLEPGQRRGNLLRMALLFGLFQGLMPLLGWLGIHNFSDAMRAYDHWIAFGLLAFIGWKMIADSFREDEDKHLDTTSLHTQIALAVATSIDALAVGISMACTGYETADSLVIPLLIIGVVSFVMSLAGHMLGARFGQAAARKWKPELIGGIILIGIGIKILLQHLLS